MSFPSTTVLWICIALFFARVVGQIEVLLVAPSWLPPMEAWYSGLLPYPILLPAQIALLMVMCALAIRTPAIGRKVVAPSAAARIFRALGVLYFVAMAVRLAVIVYTYGNEHYLHGAIPVAFHWVLALFILVCARLNAPPREVVEHYGQEVEEWQHA